MPNVYALKSVVDLRDETVSIAFDVEHRPSLHQVRTREGSPDFGQALPRRLLSYTEPNIQWGFEISMASRCFLELLAANDVQVTFQRNFALCELHFSSQFAKMSRSL